MSATYERRLAGLRAARRGLGGANDAFHSDMDVTDHQTALVEYANGVQLSFHSNSHVSLTERRWYIAGTEGTLIADLVRNKMLVRGALDLGKPERREWGGLTADAHNGADQAMAVDLLAASKAAPNFPSRRRFDGSGPDRHGDRSRDAGKQRRRLRADVGGLRCGVGRQRFEIGDCRRIVPIGRAERMGHFAALLSNSTLSGKPNAPNTRISPRSGSK
jgi:hypothetical protein